MDANQLLEALADNTSRRALCQRHVRRPEGMSPGGWAWAPGRARAESGWADGLVPGSPRAHVAELLALLGIEVRPDSARAFNRGFRHPRGRPRTEGASTTRVNGGPGREGGHPPGHPSGRCRNRRRRTSIDRNSRPRRRWPVPSLAWLCTCVRV